MYSLADLPFTMDVLLFSGLVLAIIPVLAKRAARGLSRTVPIPVMTWAENEAYRRIGEWIENGDVNAKLDLDGSTGWNYPTKPRLDSLAALYDYYIYKPFSEGGRLPADGGWPATVSDSGRLEVMPAIPTNVKHLVISNQLITRIESLPPNLESLMCICTPLTQLPPLPETLRELVCYNTFIKELPASLPPRLESLYFPDIVEHVPELPPTVYTAMGTSCMGWPAGPFPYKHTNMQAYVCRGN